LGKLVDLIRRQRIVKTRPAAGSTAEIHLFTGVRYERDGGPVPEASEKPANTPPGVKRGRG
jgi:hypothetical protein